MFARALLILSVIFGLAAGSAWAREECVAGIQAKACGCCPAPGEACCVKTPAAPARVPFSNVAPASPDLNGVLAPLVVFVGLQPQTPAVALADGRTAVQGVSSAPLLDRICVRLI
jgi:hypothetical protein